MHSMKSVTHAQQHLGKKLWRGEKEKEYLKGESNKIMKRKASEKKSGKG